MLELLTDTTSIFQTPIHHALGHAEPHTPVAAPPAAGPPAHATIPRALSGIPFEGSQVNGSSMLFMSPSPNLFVSQPIRVHAGVGNVSQCAQMQLGNLLGH
ncbi:hypothetical protein M422DRAFT_256843 [Sphaerobolus stellatus SS14]|uniref:Uncharacterized protein n=1 Tax=Sphaerobolus stellatus (strain SS14) TaxID=990650 RepID=A0A0C9UZJ8_SPHS4|nr:hypothetical protein M422DRAFT_256843 [Sphaerobolus stellatus SS14]